MRFLRAAPSIFRHLINRIVSGLNVFDLRAHGGGGGGHGGGGGGHGFGGGGLGGHGSGRGGVAVTVSVHPSQVSAGAACVRDLVGRVDLRTEIF
jgi:hypothetical protein